MDGIDKPRSRWRARALAALLLAMAAISTLSTVHAFENRELSQSAMRLRMAATEIAHADQMQQLGAAAAADDLAGPLRLLNADHDDVLELLPPDQAQRASDLLQAIRECGIMLADMDSHGGEHPPPHDHDELERLLVVAS